MHSLIKERSQKNIRLLSFYDKMKYLHNILETRYSYLGRAVNHVLDITLDNKGHMCFPVKFILPENSSYGSFMTTTH